MASKKGTNVASPVTTFTDGDTYATAFADEIQGGFHTAGTTTDRNAIPLARRKVGMHCQVIGGKVYRLINEPGTVATADTDWEEVIPAASDIKTTDGATVEAKLNGLETDVSEKQIVFVIAHADVIVGESALEQTIPFKGNITSLVANVPFATQLNKDVSLQIEQYNGSTWSIVGTITIPVGSASKYATKGLATPVAVNLLDRLRVNILSIQDGVESVNILVGIKTTK